jgi:hypothetical protein
VSPPPLDVSAAATGAVFRLPALPHLRLRITLRARSPARLVPFHGSMLRGAFGHALKRTVCALPQEPLCAECRLRHECAYAQIFETPIEKAGPRGTTPFLQGVATAPHPYLFEPRSQAAELAAGGELAFDLILFGRAIDYQGRALYAIETMAETGLGAGRTSFALAHVEAEEAPGAMRTLFSNGAWQTTDRVAGRPLPETPLPGDGRSLRLQVLTPLRLQERGRIVPPRDPRALAFAALRRLLELAHFHAPDPVIDWTFRPLLDAASTVRFVGPALRFEDLARYSQRQERQVQLGGYVGPLTLEGDLAPLGPLLRAAEVIHLGKGAVFGLGRVAIGD